MLVLELGEIVDILIDNDVEVVGLLVSRDLVCLEDFRHCACCCRARSDGQCVGIAQSKMSDRQQREGGESSDGESETKVRRMSDLAYYAERKAKHSLSHVKGAPGPSHLRRDFSSSTRNRDLGRVCEPHGAVK